MRFSFYCISAIIVLSSTIDAYVLEMSKRTLIVPTKSIHYKKNIISMKAGVSLQSTKILPRSIIPSIINNINLKWNAIVVMMAFIFGKAKNKLKKEMIKASNSMEFGWIKRGEGSSFSRTVEVWVFVISFAFRWVNKVFIL
jgi:hypothetical protein